MKDLPIYFSRGFERDIGIATDGREHARRPVPGMSDLLWRLGGEDGLVIYLSTGAWNFAGHLERFWEPRMRRQIFDYLDESAGEGLNELVLTALRRHRTELEVRAK